MKLDYEGTMRVAMPAIQLLKEREYTMNTDYANLQTFVGNCQLKLGNKQDAANSYSLAYECYLQAIEADDNIADYTSSIAGIITITDAYIQTNNYEEANEWADRFDSMLKRYRQHPQADDAFYDKQWARLNFYRGCILEGLGRKDEALQAYRVANGTRYAKTADGQIEAMHSTQPSFGSAETQPRNWPPSTTSSRKSRNSWSKKLSYSISVS